MKNYSVTKQQLITLLEEARMAPSAHNSQPWITTIEDGTIKVKIDKKHALADGDPTGRQTVISLGIFCEALTLAAAASGLQLVNIYLKEQCAVIQLKSIRAAESEAKQSLKLLRSRCSDRSVYTPTILNQSSIAKLKATANGLQSKVLVITEPVILERIAQLTSQGVGVALSSPGFRKELSQYLLLPWSKKKRGISVSSLYINPLLADLQPLLLRAGIGKYEEMKLEKRRWLSASAVVAILADGDLANYWLEAGRAYLRSSLAIEDLGLSQATSAAIVEASNYHEDIEALLHTKQRILALIRIGKGSQTKHYSPRVAAGDLLH